MSMFVVCMCIFLLFPEPRASSATSSSRNQSNRCPDICPCMYLSLLSIPRCSAVPFAFIQISTLYGRIKFHLFPLATLIYSLHLHANCIHYDLIHFELYIQTAALFQPFWTVLMTIAMLHNSARSIHKIVCAVCSIAYIPLSERIWWNEQHSPTYTVQLSHFSSSIAVCMTVCVKSSFMLCACWRIFF